MYEKLKNFLQFAFEIEYFEKYYFEFYRDLYQALK